MVRLLPEIAKYSGAYLDSLKEKEASTILVGAGVEVTEAVVQEGSAPTTSKIPNYLPKKRPARVVLQSPQEEYTPLGTQLAYNGVEDLSNETIMVDLSTDTNALSFCVNKPDQAVLEGFRNDFGKVARKIIEEEATDEQVDQMLPKVDEYYQYLLEYNKYGQVALDVKKGASGLGSFAQRHLELQAEKEGKTTEQIQKLMREYPILLAYGDASMRTLKKNGNQTQAQEYEKIAKYHYQYLEDPFKLSPYAWGGTFPDKFINSGFWMVPYNDDATISELDIMKGIKSYMSNDKVEGIEPRKALHALMGTAWDEIQEKCYPMIDIEINNNALSKCVELSDCKPKEVISIDTSGYDQCKQADIFLILSNLSKKTKLSQPKK